MKLILEREEIEKFSLSVCRNDFGIRRAVDLAGEQKFMKSAKTAGTSDRIASVDKLVVAPHYLKFSEDKENVWDTECLMCKKLKCNNYNPIFDNITLFSLQLNYFITFQEESSHKTKY